MVKADVRFWTKTKTSQLFLNAIILCFGIKTLIIYFTPVTFNIITDQLFRIGTPIMPKFSQNSGGGFHVCLNITTPATK